MAVKHMIIELGSQISRVQCFSGKEKNRRGTEKSFLFPMPVGAFSDGQITEPESLGAYVAQQLKEQGITATQVSFVVTSGRVAMREVTLPAVKENRIADIVQTNAADYFPVDLSGYHVAHSLLGPSPNGQHRVMVYAAPLPLLSGYFKLAEAAHLKVRSIDFAGNAQRQLYKIINPQGTGTLFVYLNHSSSYLTFMNGAQMILQRTLPFGGADMINDFMATAGLSSDRNFEAYQMLTDPSRFDRVRVDMSDNEIRGSLDRLAAGIARSLDYFTSNFADHPIERIVLTGPCAPLINLVDAVAAATGQNVLTMSDMSEASGVIGNAATALPYINCIAASIVPLDLMAPALTQTAKRKKKKSASLDQSVQAGVWVLILMIVLSGVLSGFAALSWIEERDKNAEITRQIDALVYTEEIYDNFVLYTNGANGFKNVYRATASGNDDLEAFLTELELKMPSEILTISASCNKESIAINGTVPTMADVARVMVQLRSFESLNDLVISSVVESNDPTGGAYASFSIDCVYAPMDVAPLPMIPPRISPNEEGMEGEMTDYDMYEEAGV